MPYSAFSLDHRRKGLYSVEFAFCAAAACWLANLDASNCLLEELGRKRHG